MPVLHATLQPADGIHTQHRWTFTSRAQMDAYGVTSADVGGVAYVQSEDAFYDRTVSGWVGRARTGSEVLASSFGFASGASPSTNRTALQAAVDAGIAAGLPVIVPAGRFLMAGGISVTSADLVLRGAGSDRTILVSPGTNITPAGTFLTFTVAVNREYLLQVSGLQLEYWQHGIVIPKQSLPAVPPGGSEAATWTAYFGRSTSFRDIFSKGHSGYGLDIRVPMIGTVHHGLNMQGSGATGCCGVYSLGAAILHHTSWHQYRATTSGAGGAGFWVDDPSITNASSGQFGLVFHQPIFEGNVEMGLTLRGASAVLFAPYFEHNGHSDIHVTTRFVSGSTVKSYLYVYGATFDQASAGQLVDGRNRRVFVSNQYCTVRLHNCYSATELDAVVTGGFTLSRVSIMDSPGFRLAGSLQCFSERQGLGLIAPGSSQGTGATPFAVGVNVNSSTYGGTALLLCSRSVGAGASPSESAVYMLRYGFSGGDFSTTLMAGTAMANFAVDGSGELLAASSNGTNLGVAVISSRSE